MRPTIEALRVVADAACGMPAAAAEFPTVFVSHTSVVAPEDVVIDGEAWHAARSFAPFDELVEATASRVVSLAHPVGEDAAREVLTRFQRFLDRRNDASRTAAFDAVLAAHRALHDVSKPLVKADLDHARDTWQWLLRLAPSASLAVQLAALFHDVERLESESDARVEHRASNYQGFKDQHARRGAELTYDVLLRCGIDELAARRARAIVAEHERRGTDRDVDLLNDADALSFFSLNSPGYLDYFGAPQTRKKIAYTLGRMSPSARSRLAHIRFRADVRSLVTEATRG